LLTVYSSEDLPEDGVFLFVFNYLYVY
jgi:hypothetical protein